MNREDIRMDRRKDESCRFYNASFPAMPCGGNRAKCTYRPSIPGSQTHCSIYHLNLDTVRSSSVKAFYNEITRGIPGASIGEALQSHELCKREYEEAYRELCLKKVYHAS